MHRSLPHKLSVPNFAGRQGRLLHHLLSPPLLTLWSWLHGPVPSSLLTGHPSPQPAARGAGKVSPQLKSPPGSTNSQAQLLGSSYFLTLSPRLGSSSRTRLLGSPALTHRGPRLKAGFHQNSQLCLPAPALPTKPAMLHGLLRAFLPL